MSQLFLFIQLTWQQTTGNVARNFLPLKFKNSQNAVFSILLPTVIYLLSVLKANKQGGKKKYILLTIFFFKKKEKKIYFKLIIPEFYNPSHVIRLFSLNFHILISMVHFINFIAN